MSAHYHGDATRGHGENRPRGRGSNGTPTDPYPSEKGTNRIKQRQTLCRSGQNDALCGRPFTPLPIPHCRRTAEHMLVRGRQIAPECRNLRVGCVQCIGVRRMLAITQYSHLLRIGDLCLAEMRKEHNRADADRDDSGRICRVDPPASAPHPRTSTTSTRKASPIDLRSDRFAASDARGGLGPIVC